MFEKDNRTFEIIPFKNIVDIIYHPLQLNKYDGLIIMIW